MIELTRGSVTYPGGAEALKPTTFGFLSREIIVLISSSGVGKSALLRCINRLVKPTAGTRCVRPVEGAELSKDLLSFTGRTRLKTPCLAVSPRICNNLSTSLALEATLCQGTNAVGGERRQLSPCVGK